jgi:hypothetical protein
MKAVVPGYNSTTARLSEGCHHCSRPALPASSQGGGHSWHYGRHSLYVGAGGGAAHLRLAESQYDVTCGPTRSLAATCFDETELGWTVFAVSLTSTDLAEATPNSDRGALVGSTRRRRPTWAAPRSPSSYFARLNSGEGTQPSLPSSSLTFHQILSFSPVGYSVVPGSRSRTTLDLLLGCS